MSRAPAQPPSSASSSPSVRSLPHNAGGARAQSQADAHLLSPHGRARQQQTGDIGARHQQKKPHAGHQYFQAARELCAQRRDPGRHRLQPKTGSDAAARRGRALGWWKHLIDKVLISRVQQWVDFVAGELDSYAFSHAPEDLPDHRPPAGPHTAVGSEQVAINGGGNAEVGASVDRQSVECLRRDPDDRKRMTVQEDAPAQHRGIAPEPPPPEVLTEYGVHGCCAFIFDGEYAAEIGACAQGREVFRRNQVDARAFGRRPIAEGDVGFALTDRL